MSLGMNEIEINMGKYRFCEFSKKEYSISFNIKGRYEYLIKEKDKKEIENLISYMGKWEGMLIPLIGIINDLEISSIDRSIDEFVSENYEVQIDFVKHLRNAYLRYIIHPINLSSSMISMEIFLTHLENAIRWKLLVDTISSLCYACAS